MSRWYYKVIGAGYAARGDQLLRSCAPHSTALLPLQALRGGHKEESVQTYGLNATLLDGGFLIL